MNDVLSAKRSLHVQRDHHDLLASNGIKKDPLRVGEYLAELREFLVDFHSSDLIYADRQLDPLHAAQRVARDLRRCIWRVIADRIGYAALAKALDFLDPTCDVTFVVNEKIALYGLGASLEKISFWEGPHNYWWSADWARIATALEAVFIDCYTAMIDALPEAHLSILHQHNKAVTEEFGDLSCRIYQLEGGSSGHDANSLANNPFSENIAASFRVRLSTYWNNIGGTTDRADNSLQADLFKTLPSTYIGFCAAGSTMLEAAMTALANAHVPVDRWANILIAANAEFSVAAAVAAPVGYAVTYSGRESNPFHVETVDHGWRLVYQRPDLAVQAEKIAKLAHLRLGKTALVDGEIMYGRGRCPANESLEPSVDEQQLRQRASFLLVDLLGPAYSSHLADMTSANGVALLTTVVPGRLLASEKILPPKPGHILENLPQLLTKEDELQFKRLAAGASQ